MSLLGFKGERVVVRWLGAHSYFHLVMGGRSAVAVTSIPCPPRGVTNSPTRPYWPLDESVSCGLLLWLGHPICRGACPLLLRPRYRSCSPLFWSSRRFRVHHSREPIIALLYPFLEYFGASTRENDDTVPTAFLIVCSCSHAKCGE